MPLANWWGDLYDARPAEREQMILDLRNSPKANLNPITGEPTEPAKRKRRRRKKPNSGASTAVVEQ